MTNLSWLADRQPREPCTKACSGIPASIAWNKHTCAAQKLQWDIKHGPRKARALMISAHTGAQKERGSYFILLSLEERAGRPQPECLQGLKPWKEPKGLQPLWGMAWSLGPSDKAEGSVPSPKNWLMWDGVCHKLGQLTTQCWHISIKAWLQLNLITSQPMEWWALTVPDQPRNFKMALPCCRTAESALSVRCSCFIHGWHGCHHSLSPPWALLWCWKMEKATWDHCPTQAIPRLSCAISSAFFQQWHFITFEWNKFFCSEIAFFFFLSVSQRSDCLLNSKANQKCCLLFILFLFLSINIAMVLIWLPKCIYLTVKP